MNKEVLVCMINKNEGLNWNDALVEANPFYQVGNPHPRWHDKNGHLLPAYESLLLTGYDAEIRYEINT